MLKWAILFAIIAVIAGILGFVVDVAGAIAKFLFFVFAIGAAVTLAMRFMKGKAGGG
jgi:uncharacterized membrane protein YtjA (UPF0391 family)